ncbi:hypothetical protein PO909_033166 [Leuciscus waleckii]
METTSPSTTEKKECKGSGLDGSSFSDLPKKPSPTTASREYKCYKFLKASGRAVDCAVHLTNMKMVKDL